VVEEKVVVVAPPVALELIDGARPRSSRTVTSSRCGYSEV
jgi:hypothetical protein